MAYSTFLQVSDLHFDAGGLSGPTGHAQLPTFHRIHKVFGGFLGHHNVALSQLEDFWMGMRDDPPLLIVTGDLSRNGHPTQLDMASAFLGGRLPSPQGGYGLENPQWTKLAIPGNHDNWPGRDMPLGHPASHLGGYLHATPSIEAVDGPFDLKIRFIRIDTDADIHPLSAARLLGQGAFETQLSQLSEILDRVDPPINEIRVLVMHHSALHRPGGQEVLAIRSTTRNLLNQFIGKYGIKVLMTGHLHDPVLDHYPAQHATGNWAVALEARCGSTTQIDSQPASNLVLQSLIKSGIMPSHPNTLILHTIVEENGHFVWKAAVHKRTRIGGFELKPYHKEEIALT